jgi:hypothetical protein
MSQGLQVCGLHGQERPSRSTGVEYEDAGREGLRESTGEIFGLMPFGCWGEEDADMEFGVEFGMVIVRNLAKFFGVGNRRIGPSEIGPVTIDQQDFHMSRDHYHTTQ